MTMWGRRNTYRAQNHSYAVWIAAPPERVYDLYVDPDRMGEWQEGNPVVSDRSGDPRLPGTTYSVRRGRFASRSEVIAAEPPISQTVRMTGMGLQADLTAEFRPENGGTRLELRLDARWVNPLVGRVLDLVVFNPRIARRELAKLKAAADREGQGRRS
jgi:uncharacterized protein YndB with AHSA1/START domain